MSDEQKTNENVVEKVVETTEVAQPAVSAEVSTEGKPARGKREFKKNKRSSKKRPTKVRSEFDQKIIDIRRVTRVASGGRRFTFSVAVVVGDRKGKIGVGTGKAGDTTLAIEKAGKDARKNTILVKTTKSMSIPHEIEAKYNSACVKIMPAPGRGVIAGSALRDIIELGGLRDLNAKIFSGSKNKLNIARATLQAFQSLEKTVKNDLKTDHKKEKKANK